MADTIVTAQYIPIEYVVRFVGLEEEIVRTFTVETLFEFQFPNLPAKVGYHASWDKTLSDINLEDTIVRAIYTPITYYLTFETGEGVEKVPSMTFTVETLEGIQLPVVPQKTGYSAVWDVSVSDIKLEDTSVRAVYTPIEYTITFVDAGKGEERKFTVETLEKLTFPTLTEKRGYLSQWDKELADVGLADLVVTAIYTPIEYKVSFACEGEYAPIFFTVESVNALRLPMPTQRLGYQGRWDKQPSEFELEDVTLTPVYSLVEYVITFAGVEESVAPIYFTIETMDLIQLPAVPEKKGYTGEWDMSISEIGVENVVIKAVYTEIPALDQMQDYGDKLVNSCFSSVSLPGVGILVILSIYCYKRKEEME